MRQDIWRDHKRRKEETMAILRSWLPVFGVLATVVAVSKPTLHTSNRMLGVCNWPI